MTSERETITTVGLAEEDGSRPLHPGLIAREFQA